MSQVDTSVCCVAAVSKKHYDDARNLFCNYASFINYDAGFPNFEAELLSLSTTYDGVHGDIIVAYSGENAVGCIAIKNNGNCLAELKRFYVLPKYHGLHIGAELLNRAIEHAKSLGFVKLRLEVIPTLLKAKQLYLSFGFEQIEPYCKVEMVGTAHFEKLL